MTELKRKRVSQGEEGPKKKTSRQDVPPPSAPSVVQISHARGRLEWKPLIASLPGLNLPTSLSWTPYRKETSVNANLPTAGIGEGSRQSEWLLHSSDHSRLDYVAKDEHTDGSGGVMKHYVGVYDPKSGKMDLIDTRRVVVRATLRQGDDTQREEKGVRSRIALRNDLGSTFGTRKAQKAIAALTENAIKTEKVVSVEGAAIGTVVKDAAAVAMLESMSVATTDMATREELQRASDESKPRPAANTAAEKLEDVYTVESLIGTDEMKLLLVKEWQDAAAANTPIPIKSRYVSQRLEKIAIGGNIKKLKILRYLLVLLNFFSSLRGKGRDGRKLPSREELRTAMEAPDQLIDSVRRRFAEGSTLNKWHVDKLIMHIAAVTLLIDDYNVDLYDLREDLRIESSPLTKYYQEIGCQVGQLTEAERKKAGFGSKTEAAMHRMARLKLPLQYPKMHVVNRRKK